jgi:hypothetical protein
MTITNPAAMTTTNGETAAAAAAAAAAETRLEAFELARLMNLLPEVVWDRCVLGDDRGVVYGWIAREEDARHDFAMLQYDETGRLYFTTSSAKHSREFSRRLSGEEGGPDTHRDCERVEDVFGGLVARKVTLL